MKEDEGHRDAQNDAELIYGNDLRGLANLQRPEIKEPRKPRREAGEDEKQPAPAADFADLSAASRHKDDKPGHNDDDHGPHRRREVGVHALDADFCEYRGERREERRTESADCPHIFIASRFKRTRRIGGFLDFGRN